MSEAEFEAWCDEDTFAEWVDGRVVPLPQIDDAHARTFNTLFSTMAVFVAEKRAGAVSAAPRQVRFEKLKTRRLPDISYIARRRRTISKKYAIDGAPDIILEIVSRLGMALDWREKYIEYEKAGVREYWIVDPISRCVELNALRAGKYHVIAQSSGKLHSTVLRGFFLRPEWLWKDVKPLGRYRELGLI